MSELKRELKLNDAISIVAGSMIGSGIFIVSSYIAKSTQSSILLILTWLIAGFTTILGALCYGELASCIPCEGGQYVYLKKIFSKKLAFIYGWTLFLVIQTGTLAAVNIAFAKFIGILFPYIASNNNLIQIHNYSFSTEQLFAILTVLFITFINSKGIKAGIITQNIFTFTKVLSLVLIIILGLFFGFNLEIFLNNFSLANNNIAFNFDTIKIIGISIVGAMFASITWNNVTFVTSEIKHPEKNIKKALIIGTGLVILLYFLLNMIYLTSLPLEKIQTSPDGIVVAQLMKLVLGKNALNVIAIIIAISAFGCANGMVLTGSRIYYKMAKDRVFFRSLAFIDRKTKVPVNSLWLQCLWVCILIGWGSYFQLLDYVIYSSLIFYAITIFGIFKMRKKFPNNIGGFKIGNIIPVLFLIVAAFVIIMLTIYKPAYTMPGLIISIIGIPVYKFWNFKGNKI